MYIYIYICVYIYTHTYRLGYSWVHCEPQAQDVPIMGPTWAHDGWNMDPSWAHDGPIMGHRPNTAPSWAQHGPNMGPSWRGWCEERGATAVLRPPPMPPFHPPSPFVDCSCINKYIYIYIFMCIYIYTYQYMCI
jgi:hypothetical protein